MKEHIEKHLPELRKLITSNVFKNDSAMRVVLSKGYTFLPGTIRIFLKEETFVNFCMEHKHTLFGKPTEKTVVKGKDNPAIKKAVKKLQLRKKQ